MGSVVISGATSGAITLAVPAEAGTERIRLQSESGTRQLLNRAEMLSSAGDKPRQETQQAWVAAEGTYSYY